MNYAKINKQWWEKMAKEGCGFTKPWLNLQVSMLKRIAEGKIKNISKPLNDIYPISLLADVKGKDVLCLASGGGQQSAVFGLLGARVTVFDISEAQLAGDRAAAAHYGYIVKTIQGDISNISALKNKSFDLVYQAPSMCYIRDVKNVYSEVSRILRSGGIYRADALNPLSQFADEASWDGKGYRISVPYNVRKKKRAKNQNVIEFRHYLDEVFNGLIENGFIITHVQEMPKGLYQDKKDKPGSWGHFLRYIHGYFCILAQKQ